MFKSSQGIWRLVWNLFGSPKRSKLFSGGHNMLGQMNIFRLQNSMDFFLNFFFVPLFWVQGQTGSCSGSLSWLLAPNIWLRSNRAAFPSSKKAFLPSWRGLAGVCSWGVHGTDTFQPMAWCHSQCFERTVDFSADVEARVWHFMTSLVRLLPVNLAVYYMTLFENHIKARPNICFLRSISPVHPTR